jgi:outer membrane protein
MLNLLQIPLDTEFRIKQEKVDAIPEMPTEGITDIYERALGILPEIQQSQNQILQAMYNEKIARSAFSPSVSVFGNLSTVYSESARQPNGQYSVATIGYVEGINELVQTFIPLYQSIPYSGQIQDNFGVTFGASVSVPIFNGMRNSTNLENAKLNSEIAQIQYESIKTNLRSEITNAYTNLLAAKSRYDASINNEKAQKLNYDYAEKRFAAGLINSTELMTAKNLWFQSQNMLLNAKFEYVFRSLLIQYYLGNPLELN